MTLAKTIDAKDKYTKGHSELPNISNGARCHHEKYDDSGYSDKLAGVNISLTARLIGAADA